MSDSSFQRNLCVVIAVAVIWIIAGIILELLPVIPVVIIGLAIAFVGGGALIHSWGKDYVTRR